MSSQPEHMLDADPSSEARPQRSRWSSSGLGGRSKRTMGLVAGAGVAVWLLLVFGSALARSDAIDREAAALRAENAAMQARIAAGRDELAIIQTEDFLSFQARGYGMGDVDERPFALSPDASPPAPIVPLGGPSPGGTPATPLDEWLDLLFR